MSGLLGCQSFYIVLIEYIDSGGILIQIRPTAEKPGTAQVSAARTAQNIHENLFS